MIYVRCKWCGIIHKPGESCAWWFAAICIASVILLFYLTGCGSTSKDYLYTCPSWGACEGPPVVPSDAPVVSPDALDPQDAPDPVDGSPPDARTPADARADTYTPADAGPPVPPDARVTALPWWYDATLPELLDARLWTGVTTSGVKIYVTRSYTVGDPYSCDATPTPGIWNCYCRPGYVPRLYAGEVIDRCDPYPDDGKPHTYNFASKERLSP